MANAKCFSMADDVDDARNWWDKLGKLSWNGISSAKHMASPHSSLKTALLSD